MPLIVNDILACAVGSAPGRLAVTLGEETMTFGQVESCANRFSHALLALGRARGSAWHGGRRPRFWEWGSSSPRAASARPSFPSTPPPPTTRSPRYSATCDLSSSLSTRRTPRACRAPRRRPRHLPGHRGRWAHGAARGGPQRPGGGCVARRSGHAAARRRCDLHHLLDQREHGASQGGDGVPARHLAADPRRCRRPLDDGGRRRRSSCSPCSIWRVGTSP